MILMMTRSLRFSIKTLIKLKSGRAAAGVWLCRKLSADTSSSPCSLLSSIYQVPCLPIFQSIARLFASQEEEEPPVCSSGEMTQSLSHLSFPWHLSKSQLPQRYHPHLNTSLLGWQHFF